MWAVLEAAGTAYDVYDLGSTLFDKCADWTDVGIGAGGLLMGTVLPGAGYGKGLKLFKRSKFRKKAIKDMKTAAPRNSNGDMTCPTCNEVMPETITRQTVNGPIDRRGFDGDHYPDPWADRVREMEQRSPLPTRGEVLDEYNRRLRAQCPTCNQGHQFEGVP